MEVVGEDRYVTVFTIFGISFYQFNEIYNQVVDFKVAQLEFLL